MVLASPAALRTASFPSVSGPTRLRVPDLLHATDRAADNVLSGDYDHLLPSAGVPPTTAGSAASMVTTKSTSG
ncbi:putative cysteine dioxygenase [Mycobacterium xenopi 3993]|nr:putative cysteine dioxygenase [Mycobacterium xenopi 3993]